MENCKLTTLQLDFSQLVATASTVLTIQFHSEHNEGSQARATFFCTNIFAKISFKNMKVCLIAWFSNVSNLSKSCCRVFTNVKRLSRKVQKHLPANLPLSSYLTRTKPCKEQTFLKNDSHFFACMFMTFHIFVKFKVTYLGLCF